MDLHQKEIQGFFNIPVDNLRASPFLLQYIQEEVISKNRCDTHVNKFDAFLILFYISSSLVCHFSSSPFKLTSDWLTRVGAGGRGFCARDGHVFLTNFIREQKPV